jgi:hypothetical protein
VLLHEYLRGPAAFVQTMNSPWSLHALCLQQEGARVLVSPPTTWERLGIPIHGFHYPPKEDLGAVVAQNAGEVIQ